MTAANNEPAKAGRREWFGLLILAFPVFIVSIDLFVLLLALPHLVADLGAEANEQLWITDIYGFVLAGFLVTMGTLGDRIGRRKLLLIGSVAFGIGSILCAYSTSPEMLIGARALLGIAGATLMPSAMGLISALFRDPKQMATAFAIFAATFSVGAVFGPIIGGVLMAHFWWGSVFLLGVPLMVLLVLIGPKLLPEAKDPNPGKLDGISAVLSLLALLPIIYGIKELTRYGWAVIPVVALVVGLGFGVVFIRRQRRIASPLLDVKLLRNPVVSGGLIGMLSFAMLGAGMMLLMLLYFQLVGGMTTLQAGLTLVPGMLASILGSQLAPKLAARFRPGYVLGVALFGCAIGYGSMIMVSSNADNTSLVISFAVACFFGTMMPGLGYNLVVGSAPTEQAGSAGALAQLSNELGGTIGLAIYGTVGAFFYRATLDLPEGIPADTANAVGDSFAGAAAAARNLPADTAESVMGPAREAFTSGLHAVAVIGAVIMAATAALLAVRLRHVPPFGQEQQQEEVAAI